MLKGCIILSQRHSQMSIVVLLIISRKWKQSGCPLNMEMWFTYKVEHYSAIKSKIMKLTLTTKKVILSVVTQTKKEKYSIFSYIWILAI